MDIGSLVECINDVFDLKQLKLIDNKPKKGKIYTIRRIQHYPNNKVGVLLEEIINEPLITPNVDGLFEPTFNIERFRELPEINIDELTEIFELDNK
jgi:hypothetical protein